MQLLRVTPADIDLHGLGGVQNRHYDRHDYALEKRQALERWARAGSRIVPFALSSVTTSFTR